MKSRRNNLRYYYWLALEFFKKNVKLISLSFLISALVVVVIVSISPYLVNITIPHKESVGLIGEYTVDNLPDEIQNKVSNGLLYINNQGEFIPAIASSWEILDKGRQYRVFLKKDLLWNDNRPFKAKDVNYSFKDISVKYSGDYVIEFTLSKPLATFPNYLTKPIMRYPMIGVAGLYRTQRIKKKNDTVTEIVLAPNRSNMPVLTYKFYENESKLITAYKLGEINKMVVYKKSLADGFSRWKNTKITATVDYNRLMTMFINFKNPLFKEKEVRQALAMAINRDKLLDIGVPATGPVPPISWAYSQNVKKNVYDPETARKVIHQYTESTPSAKININTYYEYLDMAEVVSGFLKDSGLQTNIEVLYSSEPSNFDLLLTYWNVPFDPDQYYFWHSTQRLSTLISYKNLKIDKLLEDGRDTSNLKDRKKIYYDFQRNILDDTPAVFIYYPYVYTVEKK